MRTLRSVAVVLALGLGGVSAASAQQIQVPQHLEDRLDVITRQVTATPTVEAEMFTAAFRQAAPPEQVEAILTSLYQAHGAVEETEVLGRFNPSLWLFRWRYEDGAMSLVQFGVDGGDSNRIGALLIGQPFTWGPSSR